ncbi:MAG: hypothetical protein E7391_01355 [Ruminococcaceae bacterium]|nr:hypothetical protein [Oscillospiraceae bacterium]
MLSKILAEKNLPPLKTRDEMINILQKEVYGYLPEKPDEISFEVKENIRKNFCASKAVLNEIKATVKIGEETFTFPFMASIPTGEGKHPFFVHINFRDQIPDLYMGVEEIIDNGFAVLSFCYKDITSDDNNFTNGLAGVFYKNKKREGSNPGKIAMWAWTAMRVMDWACTQDNLDKNCAIVCGHSRLGKTALLTGALDERFKFVHSNNSGCCGAAISRGKVGESVEKIIKVFEYWFCDNFKKYANNEDKMPFDQHYLLASIAPRYVNVASAVLDTWADPDSEMLSCVAASKMYEDMGLKGFICENRLPCVGVEYHEGNIGYHLRGGSHYFSREDWIKLIKFINKKRGLK